MRATYGGTLCLLCGQPIKVGEDIRKRKGTFAHTACFPGADDQ